MPWSGIFQTTAATGGAREDILDLITQISPYETPFLSRCGVSKANGVLHNWLTDVMNATAATGDYLVEGESATNAALQDKTRYNNYTAITERTFTISGTEEAVWEYGLDSQYAYQLEKAMKELKIKIERILLGGSAASAGAADVARSIAGAFKFGVSNGATASGAASVSALTESIYNGLVEDVFDLGGQPDTTFVNGFLKRRISSFASPNNRTIEMGPNQKKLTGVITVYESDFGAQEIILDRWCQGLANGEKGAGLVVDMSKMKIAYLRKPFTNPLGVTGDRKAVQLLTEYTLEALAPTQIGVLSAFSTA